jgi:hypothetical protein
MSEERGVMPSEGVHDAPIDKVTPSRCEGALGTWRSQDGIGRRAEECLVLEAGTISTSNRRTDGRTRARA